MPLQCHLFNERPYSVGTTSMLPARWSLRGHNIFVITRLEHSCNDFYGLHALVSHTATTTDSNLLTKATLPLLHNRGANQNI